MLSDGCRSAAGDVFPDRRPGPWLSFAETLQREVPNGNIQAGLSAKMLGQFFGRIHRPVLPAGAAKGDHQIFETPFLICLHTGFHKRENVGKELMCAFLLDQVFDDGGVLPCEIPESFFATGIGKRATIEDESPAVSRLIYWDRAAMK